MTDVSGRGLQRGVKGGSAPPRADDTHRAPSSLDEAYRAHAGFVWRIVRRLGVDDAAVEDVMHDVFLVVDRRLGEYDGRASFTTWLYHLARGVVSNHRRSAARQARRLSLARAEPPRAVDVEEHAQRAEAARFVRSFLAQLDPPKREVFALADIDGLAIPEVASLLGIKLNTAYSRLRAARQAFARAVQRRGGSGSQRGTG